jgi:hypothetical protein
MPKSVGVASSIVPIDQPFKDALINQLNADVAGGVMPTYATDTNVGNWVTDWNNAHPKDLIITLGGRMAHEAAVTASSAFPQPKPFMSLMGAAPDTLPNGCVGGVSLESYAHNLERVKYLIARGYNSISLFYNQNAPTSIRDAELANWQSLAMRFPHQVVRSPVQAMLGNRNDQRDYTTTVPTIVAGAVIVSPDPFFYISKDALLQAFNSRRRDLYVCYPLHDHANGATKPNHGSATLHGPKLKQAIKLLGAIAAFYLNDGLKPGFLQMPVGEPKDVV